MPQTPVTAPFPPGLQSAITNPRALEGSHFYQHIVPKDLSFLFSPVLM